MAVGNGENASGHSRTFFEETLVTWNLGVGGGFSAQAGQRILLRQGKAAARSSASAASSISQAGQIAPGHSDPEADGVHGVGDGDYSAEANNKPDNHHPDGCWVQIKT